MLIGRRYSQGALVVGLMATIVMGVVGACATVTGGTGKVDAADAPAYRTSVASSVSESAATASARESERQESMTTEAVHGVCETLSTTSADAIDTVNAYVDAFNGEGDPAATEGAASDALLHSADLVAADLNDNVPPEVRDALNGWGDAARAAADAITTHAEPSEFNDAIDRLNDARSHALDLCDATY